MSKLQNAWVIAESAAGISTLSAGAVQLGEATALMHCENVATESWLSYIPAIVEKIKERKPEIVLVEATKNGRLTAAAIAAAMDTSVLTDATELKIEDGVVVSKRMVYGGAAFKTEKASGTAVACVGAGAFDADGSIATEVIAVKAASAGIRFVENRPKETQSVNLAAAKVIVGVGRGFGKAENVQLAQELAAAVGGEVGCSRPVAEEEKWLPKEVYIGVSGAMIKPDVYIGCGISGQIQHMVGINQAKVIVAVNKDKNASIFKQCDYGIVGDLNTILPALTKKFQN